MRCKISITKKQQAFINAKYDEVLFGGAAGGGKSYAQLIDALLYALKYPGSRQLILRRTFPDLERSLIAQHLKFYPRSFYTYLKTAHTGRFKNGSVIEFGYCDSETDVYRYQGAEYDVIRFDELTHFTESMYLYLHSRVRGANKFPKSVKCTTNPGGIGHTWVKKRFIDIGEWGKPHKAALSDNENADYTTRIFIQSFVQDNEFLMKHDKGYLKRLQNLAENERLALLNGEWNLADGRFFYEFSRDVHVIKPVKLKKHWRRYVSIDYGMDMLAALWIAIDNFGRAYVYRELYEGRDNKKGKDGKGHIISSAAKRIIAETAQNEEIYAYLAPPDLWNRRQETGKSAAEIFADNKVYLTKTSNDRKSGWLSVREWLKLEKNEFGQAVPKLCIFEKCNNLIRTLGALQYSEKCTEDAALSPHELTHAPDALRGFCVYHSACGAEKKEEEDTLRKNFNFGKKSLASALGEGEPIHII